MAARCQGIPQCIGSDYDLYFGWKLSGYILAIDHLLCCTAGSDSPSPRRHAIRSRHRRRQCVRKPLTLHSTSTQDESSDSHSALAHECHNCNTNDALIDNQSHRHIDSILSGRTPRQRCSDIMFAHSLSATGSIICGREVTQSACSE